MVLEQGAVQTADCVSAIAELNRLIDILSNSTLDTLCANEQIAAAVTQQGAAAESINQSVYVIRDLAEDTRQQSHSSLPTICSHLVKDSIYSAAFSGKRPYKNRIAITKYQHYTLL